MRRRMVFTGAVKARGSRVLSGTLAGFVVLVLLAATIGRVLAAQEMSRATASYPDSRRVDTANQFPYVGALITTAVQKDAGLPEGFLAKCSGVLIGERAFLTAGHCICPALPAIPAFARLHVTFDRNARDESKWRTVARVMGHPSLLPCAPPRFSNAWPGAPHPGLSDVGLVFLTERVSDVAHVRLAPVGALATTRAMRTGMPIVGYGQLQALPREREFTDWDGLRRVRVKRLSQVVDATWATWYLPAELCGGDSGGPILLDGRIAALVWYAGRDCREASIHARIDIASVQTWIEQTIQSSAGDR